MDISKNNKYIIQGFGNVGSNTAKFLSELGMNCVGVGDHSGYWSIPKGVDIKSLIEYVKKNRKIEGYFESESPISKEDFFLKLNVFS